jgi:hypothetical protein
MRQVESDSDRKSMTRRGIVMTVSDSDALARLRVSEPQAQADSAVSGLHGRRGPHPGPDRGTLSRASPGPLRWRTVATYSLIGCH